MFKINSTRVDGETLTTNVTYTMPDGVDVVVDVAHFMPDSTDAVIESIQLREASEIAKYQSKPVVKSIKDELDAMDFSVKA